jgi:4-amino-4-deoxy-L-arabinose transferase-like glycosyltransferase
MPKGRKNFMKGGDGFLSFLFAPSESEENKSGLFWLFTICGIIIGLIFLFKFVIAIGGGGGGGKI